MRRLVILGVLAALAVASLGAQQPAAQPDTWAVLTYIKVAPEHMQAYREVIATQSKKVFAAWAAADRNLVHWSAAQVLYPAPDAPYNWIGATVHTGPPPQPGNTAAIEPLLKQTLGLSLAEFEAKVGPMRKVVGTQLLRRRGAAMGQPTSEGDVRVMFGLKINAGMGNEFWDRTTNATQPIWQERATRGEIRGWSLWSRSYPWKDGEADAYGVVVHKDFASALKGIDQSTAAEIFAKVHPGKNYAAFINDGRDYSDIVSTEIAAVVASVNQQPRQGTN
jgi:type II secretory pathway pseudopilin PulG